METKLCLVLVLLVSLLSIIKIIPQGKEDSSKVKLKIEAFSNMLRNFDGTFEEKLNNIDTLKKMTRILFEANESDAMAVYNIKGKPIKFNKLKSNGKVNTTPPAMIISSILINTLKNFSYNIFALAATSYFIKVKIINSELTKDSITENIGGTIITTNYLSRWDITAEVEEVIKGKNTILVGEVIKFYFHSGLESGGKGFNKEMSYFLPLEVLTEYKTVLWLKPLDESGRTPSQGCFPIENNNLIDVNNYFGFGEIIPWPEFRDKMISLINLIKSW